MGEEAQGLLHHNLLSTYPSLSTLIARDLQKKDRAQQHFPSSLISETLFTYRFFNELLIFLFLASLSARVVAQ